MKNGLGICAPRRIIPNLLPSIMEDWERAAEAHAKKKEKKKEK